MNKETRIAIEIEPVVQTGNNWDTFVQTGNIEAYLLYKFATGFYDEKEKDSTWRKSERRALS